MMNVQINQQKDKVVFFESPAGGAHTQAQRSMLWDLKSNKISTIFDYYEQQQPKIQSLFVQHISSNYWLPDGEHVIISTIHHSKEELLILNVLTKAVKVIDLPEPMGEATILNLKDNLLVLRCSSPNQPPTVLIGFVNVNSPSPIEFKQTRTKLSRPNHDIKFRIIKQNEDKLLEQVETILIGPTSTFNEPTPVIVIPHGKDYDF